MQPTGISLNNESNSKQRTTILAAVSVALAGFAVAGAAFGFACSASRGDAEREDARGVQVDTEFSTDATATAGGAGADENTGGAPNADEPAASDESGNQSADEPMATPTEDPTATPTATPDGDDPCPLCPDDVDDFVAPPVTPVPPCALCFDADFVAEGAPLAFEYYTAEHCDGTTAMSAGLNRVAWIWAEYTESDGSEIHQTPKQWNDSLYVEVVGSWVWFGSWGWIYTYDITFHAMDEDGDEIQAFAIDQNC